jgi:LacI family transcriptional regulator
VFGPRDTFSSPARERGFRRRLDEVGIVIPDERWLVGETSYEHGWDSAMRIIDQGALPAAVFCSADLIAFGAISAFRHRGIRIPDDLWVMGNDGLPMSAWEPFDLTTHRQPIDEIARLGMERLVARMGGDADAPQRIVIPTDLIVRGSTAHAG